MKKPITQLLLATAMLLINNFATAQIIFDANLETGNFSQLQGCGSDVVHGSSVQVVNNPAVSDDNPTAKVARYQINQSQERSENRVNNPGSLGEYWYGWQMYLPNNWQPAIGNTIRIESTGQDFGNLDEISLLTSGQDVGGLSVRARGTTGEEELALLIDNGEVIRWSLTSQWASYTYAGSSVGSLKLAFVNDGWFGQERTGRLSGGRSKYPSGRRSIGEHGCLGW